MVLIFVLKRLKKLLKILAGCAVVLVDVVGDRGHRRTDPLRRGQQRERLCRRARGSVAVARVSVRKIE